MTSRIEERVRAAGGGDEEALLEVLQRYLPDLHAFVRLRAGRLVLDREASADVVQSVAREALGEFAGFEWQGEPAFRAWLYTVARRKIADRHAWYRTEKRDIERETPLGELGPVDGSAAAADLADSYAALVSPSRRAEAGELLEEVEGAFAHLSEEHREVILLARFAGLSHREIAARMDKSEGATRMLLSRALTALARHLDRDADDGGRIEGA